MPDLMSVCAYMRVSTRDKQTLDSQRHAIKQFCEARGFSLVMTYEDRASGADKTRPGLDALFTDLHRPTKRKWSAVVVYRLDRLSRAGIFDLLQTTLVMRDVGVDLISVTEPIDTSTSVGRLYFSIAACIAEIERDHTRERVKDGLAAARAAGKILGRPSITIPTADLRLMVDLRKMGSSWAAIRKETGELWTTGTIRNRVNLAIRQEAVTEKMRVVHGKGRTDGKT